MSEGKIYEAIVWTGDADAPGQRIEVFAADGREAGKLIREKYGSDCSLWVTNDEEAEKLR